MKLYWKGTRNGSLAYGAYFGYTEQQVLAMLADLGYSDTAIVSTDEYNANTVVTR